jgi:hypothetical protein
VLSPYYVPRNTAIIWWDIQKRNAAFLSPSYRLSGARKPSVLAKVGYGATVMPIGAVVALPYGLVRGGVMPMLGHTADILISPFGRPLRFHRLDSGGFKKYM